MKLTAITMGDPSGIGPEVSLKALAGDPAIRDRTLLMGSSSIILMYKRLLGVNEEINTIAEPEAFREGVINVIDVVDLVPDSVPIGRINSAAGDAAYRYLERAISLALEGRIGPIVTGPINKEALNRAGHHYDGHTEIFAKLTGTSTYAMMLWSQVFSVVHVSTHVALREACDRVTRKRVLDCIHLGVAAFRQLGVAEPRIAVAGLNPHAGEGGLFGREEIEEISPAVESARSEGINVTGPMPPDTVYLMASQGKFDLVVAMYHDQGHIPMKLLAFDSGVNVTLGLPIIRTSVDHGTALDIAGRGIARQDSMLHAIRLANRFAGTATSSNHLS